MVSNRWIAEELKQDMLDEVRTELIEYKTGRIDKISTNKTLADKYEMSEAYASQLIRSKLNDEEKRLRRKILLSHNKFTRSEIKKINDYVMSNVEAFIRGETNWVYRNDEIVERLDLDLKNPGDLYKYLDLPEDVADFRKKQISKYKNLTRDTLNKLKRLEDYVIIESVLHKQGVIDELFTLDRIMEEFELQVSHPTLKKHVDIPEDIKNYRKSTIGSQIRITQDFSDNYKDFAERRARITEFVVDEIEKYKKGEIDKLSTNTELGEMFGIQSSSAVSANLREVPKELREFRYSAIQRDTVHKLQDANKTRTMLTEEKKEAINNFLKEQIRLHKEGKVDRLYQRSELLEEFDVNLKEPNTLSYALDLTDEEHEYWISVIAKQVGETKFRKLSDEDIVRLNGFIINEVEDHKAGKTDHISKLEEICDALGFECATGTLQKYIEVPKDVMRYRKSRLVSQGKTGVTEKQIEKINEIIEKEVEEHKAGERAWLSSNAEVLNAVGLGHFHPNGISSYYRIPKEITKYRTKVIMRQHTKLRNAMQGLPNKKGGRNPTSADVPVAIKKDLLHYGEENIKKIDKEFLFNGNGKHWTKRIPKDSTEMTESLELLMLLSHFNHRKEEGYYSDEPRIFDLYMKDGSISRVGSICIYSLLSENRLNINSVVDIGVAGGAGLNALVKYSKDTGKKAEFTFIDKDEMSMETLEGLVDEKVSSGELDPKTAKNIEYHIADVTQNISELPSKKVDLVSGTELLKELSLEGIEKFITDSVQKYNPNFFLFTMMQMYNGSYKQEFEQAKKTLAENGYIVKQRWENPIVVPLQAEDGREFYRRMVAIGATRSKTSKGHVIPEDLSYSEQHDA